MRLGALSDCGPNPCGFTDALWPSSECESWQVCAAVQNNAGAPAEAGCVVGGTNAYGDTIVSCGGAPPCLMGSGPLAPGQQYCAGVIDAEQLLSQQYFASQGAGPSSPPWAMLGLVALGLILVGTRR